MRQHARAFIGPTDNMVMTQFRITIPVYVFISIVKKRLRLPQSLNRAVQILSISLCEQMPLDELLAYIDADQNPSESDDQMNLCN